MSFICVCVRACGCGVRQSDTHTLLYTLVCVSLRAAKIKSLPYAPLLDGVQRLWSWRISSTFFSLDDSAVPDAQ